MIKLDPATMASTTLSKSSLSQASSSPASNYSPTVLSSASTGPASASPSPPSGQSSSTPVGAIAGGVVSGIVALSLFIFLTWFLLRRRRQAHKSELHGNTHTVHEKYASTSSSGGAVYEVGEHESRMPVAEMAGNTRPVELDGTGAAR